MSALDWGAGAGSNPTPRYHTVASPALPNSDWVMGAWVRKLAITGSYVQFVFALGTSSAANSAYAYIGETAFGYTIGCEVINSAGTSWLNSAKSGTPVQDGLDYLCVVQRRSNNIEAYLIQEGATVSAADLSAAGISGTFNATTIKLGYDPGAQLRNPFGEFFLFTDRSFSLSQLTTLAAGARPKTSNVGGEPLILLPFRSGDVASETNLGTGGATYDSTRVSSGFTTTTDFFTLPTNPAITSVSTMTPRQGEPFTITGTNFGATQGSGYVSLGGATQYTTLSWSDTSVTIVVDRTTNKYGVGVTVQVIDNSLNTSGPYALTGLLPTTGWDYVDIGTPNTTAAYRLTAVPDAVAGDQCSWGNIAGTGSVAVASDLTYEADLGVTAFDVEFWTTGDGWGSTATQLVDQFVLLAPSGDVVAGSWTVNTGGSLYAALDESSPSDEDYASTLTLGDTCAVSFPAATDPAVSTGHKVRYRIRGDGVSGVQVSLMQNTTVIASWTHDPAPSQFTTYEQVLSGAEADSISNYSALRIRVTEI